jgi:hypothetical protein
MTKRKSDANRTKGGVRRPRSPGQAYSYVLDMGLQDAQRCMVCNRRKWVGARRLSVCPSCTGAMLGTRERRMVEKSGFAPEREAKTAKAAAVVKMSKGRYRPNERVNLAAFLRDT